MAYIWFNAVLEALGKRLNYESVSNLYGNSFAKDAGKHVQAANPLIKHTGSSGGGITELLGKVKIIDASNAPEIAKQAVEEKLGDISWAEGLF